MISDTQNRLLRILPRAVASGLLLALTGLLLSAEAGPRRNQLVSTAWLARQLGRPAVIVLHVAADRKSYDEGHIPGARFVPFNEIVTPRDGVTNELPPVESLQRLFTRLGIGEQARLVVYGDLNGLAATRTLFTLAYLGHLERSAILDGGLEKWKAEARPLEKASPNFTPASFTPRPNPTLVAGIDQMRDLSWVAANVVRANVTIIDSRSAEVYAGDAAKKTGHIPGAVNLYWMENLNGRDGALKPLDQLKKLYGALGLSPGQRIVSYCNSGMQASHTWFILHYLGYDSQLYDGSMGEWSKSANTSIVSGPARR